MSRLRRAAAPRLAAAVTQAMQQLGMAGGRFEVALAALDAPQSFGLENVELQVAGHAGSSPRPLAKVASGGELSRLALAIAVTTARAGAAQGVAVPTLIFDEIDAGVGGNVAYQVGRLMKQLGGSSQVLAVTHLAQVAACADHHFVVSKALQGQATVSDVAPVSGEARVSEVARMLGGERLSDTSRAHALAMLGGNAQAAAPAPGQRPEGAHMNAAAAAEPGRWPEVERRKAARDGADAGDASERREVVLITGISGSGKSVALHALEDAGFFCVDNLPPEMLRDFIRLEHERFTHRVAVAVDVRNAVSLPQLVPLIQRTAGRGRAHPLAVSRCQHRCAGAALFRNAPTAPAVGCSRRR